MRPQYFMRASVLKRMTQTVSFSLKRAQLFIRLNLWYNGQPLTYVYGSNCRAP